VLNSLLKEATTPTPPLAAPGSKKIYQRWWQHAPNENVAFGADVFTAETPDGNRAQVAFWPCIKRAICDWLQFTQGMNVIGV